MSSYWAPVCVSGLIVARYSVVPSEGKGTDFQYTAATHYPHTAFARLMHTFTLKIRQYSYISLCSHMTSTSAKLPEVDII